VAAPALALAFSERQRAAWERRREWEEHEEERAELRASCVSARSLRKMREKRGRGVKVADLAELDAVRFDGEKAARPFLRILAGVLLHSRARGVAGAHADVALMLGAFGHPVGETCVRRALASLEAAKVIATCHDFQRHPKERPFVSKKDKRRPVRLVTERGRIIVAGPVLELALDHLRAGSAARRKKQGCSKKTTHSDPLPSGEIKNTDRARASTPTPAVGEKPKPEPATPVKERPSAASQINTRPPAATEKAAMRKGEGARSATAAKLIAVAPTIAAAAIFSTGGRPTSPQPSEPQASPWRRVWVAADVEQQLADHCRVNKRKRADVVAEAMAVYTGGAIAPTLRLVPPPKPAAVSPAPPATPVERASDDFARLAIALTRAQLGGRITSAELAAFSSRMEAGDVAQVAAELAPRLDSVSPPAEPAPPACEQPAAIVDDAAEAAAACRAWLEENSAGTDDDAPPAPPLPAPAVRSTPHDDPELLAAELRLGDWRPSPLGGVLAGALTSLSRRVRDD
jgi:hypothetical protein